MRCAREQWIEVHCEEQREQGLAGGNTAGCKGCAQGAHAPQEQSFRCPLVHPRPTLPQAGAPNSHPQGPRGCTVTHASTQTHTHACPHIHGPDNTHPQALFTLSHLSPHTGRLWPVTATVTLPTLPRGELAGPDSVP